MNAAAWVLIGFWLGGCVTTVALIALESERVGPGGLPPVAYERPVRFGLLLVAFVLAWPAAIVLLLWWIREQREEQEAAQAEHERIEATRERDE